MFRFEFDVMELDPEFRLAIKTILSQLDLCNIDRDEKAVLRKTILDQMNNLQRKIIRGLNGDNRRE